jgi:xanthine dehydrogenase accessory factor
MISSLSTLLSLLAHEPAVLVRVARVQGSVPRETGAWMAILAEQVIGTIGGGHLEFEVIAQAHALLAGTQALPDGPQRYALGPSLGQCCGGVMWLSYEKLTAAEIADLPTRLQTEHRPLALFGGGHVGQALVKLLADLPFAVRWIDSREAIVPAERPVSVVFEHSAPVQDAVRDLVPGSAVLIMSFSHAEDLEIVAHCLRRARERDDLPYIGLIGSKTKWATFRHRLEARGFNDSDFVRVTCPIGMPGIEGKQPEVIAVAVAAQLLQRFGPS